MRPKPHFIHLVLAGLLLAACGTTSSPPDASTDVRSPGPGDPGDSLADTGEEGPKEDGKGTGRGGGNRGGEGETSGPGDGTADVGGPGDDPAGSDGSGKQDGSGHGGSAPASSPAGAGGVASPAAGTYVYAQKGFEEFCSTGCERDRLPPRQNVSASYGTRSASSTVVVTEARASGDRLVRTTTRYTKAAAEVLEVHLEYSYEGFNFSRTYRPEPPVASLRFPLRAGRSWSGRWSGDVSGRYSVDVVGRERFAGSRVAQLQTKTRFRGDLNGRANVTLWVDPGDGTVMRTAGNMTVDMGFGTYRSGFATALRSAP
jgi:hypothetical protein